MATVLGRNKELPIGVKEILPGVQLTLVHDGRYRVEKVEMNQDAKRQYGPLVLTEEQRGRRFGSPIQAFDFVRQLLTAGNEPS